MLDLSRSKRLGKEIKAIAKKKYTNSFIGATLYEQIGWCQIKNMFLLFQYDTLLNYEAIYRNKRLSNCYSG